MSNQIEQENLNDMENLNKIAVNFVDELFGKFEEEDSNQLPEEQNNSSATPVDIEHKENKNEKSQKSKQNNKTIAKDKIRKAYIPPKPQTSAKKKTIKNRNNDDINDKNYYTEQNQKGNYLKQSQKRMNKKKKEMKIQMEIIVLIIILQIYQQKKYIKQNKLVQKRRNYMKKE